MHKPFINRHADRALAVGVLLVGLFSGYVFFNQVYMEQLISLNHEVELQKKKNAKINSILNSEKDLGSKIRQQKKAIRNNRIFLKNNKQASAASELQNYIKSLVTKHSNAKILAIKPYPVKKHDDYSETSLEIRIKGIGHEGLQRVLYMIESNAPVLLIKELDIKLTQRRFTSVVASKTIGGNLALTMVVSAFYRELSGGGQQ